MTGPLDELLTALTSPSWMVVREAVDQASERLRGRLRDERATAEIAAHFVRLSDHPKWEVRKAIADAILHFYHETFHVVLVKLLADDNAYVRDAALRSRARRTELIRADILKEQHGDLLMTWLSDLEARHGPRARADAMRVAEKYVALFVREARHEIVKVIAPLDLSIMNLREGLEQLPIDPAACAKHADRAQDRLRLLTAIVDSLRDFTAEVTPEFHGEDLRDVLEMAVALVREGAGEKRKQIEVTISAGTNTRVSAQRYRLVQAFSNIVQNAFEAYEPSSPPATIEIRARREDQLVIVSVADTGCGMNEEALRDAFRLFSTKKPNGTGFGLPLARKIIETEHRGSIELISARGRGTTVIVVLPVESGE